MTSIFSLLLGAAAGYLYGTGHTDNAIIMAMFAFAFVVLGPLIFPSEPS